MNNSVFSKIYSYRERENKNSKENFLIEIFAHCLLTDKNLLKSFLELIGIFSKEEISIKTQAVYEYGRPDIEINLLESKTCILIECKIEHFERQNQLEDYKKILLDKERVKNKHLVFLTKYYEYRENDNKKIDFTLIRWSDIYMIINDENNLITNELKEFLKDENMAESKNFNYNDIVTLLNITETLSKMDEVIDSIKEYFEKHIGLLSKDSSRSTRMIDSWYVAYHSVGKPKFKFSIDIGFIWWDDDVYIMTRIYIPRANKYTESEKYKDFFLENLEEWSFDEFDSAYTFISSKLVSEFVISEEEQIPPMREFLKEQIDKLIKLKKLNSNIFK